MKCPFSAPILVPYPYGVNRSVLAMKTGLFEAHVDVPLVQEPLQPNKQSPSHKCDCTTKDHAGGCVCKRGIYST